MPIQPTYPGVYIDEVASPSHTIVQVPTGMTAFVGPAARGPVNTPVRVTDFSQYAANYGGITSSSLMSYAVYQYFLNGGQEALIVRAVRATSAQNPAPAKAAVLRSGNAILTATSEGTWANGYRINVSAEVGSVRLRTASEQADNTSIWNVTLHDTLTGIEERYTNVSSDPGSPQSLQRRLMQESSSFRVTQIGALTIDKNSYSPYPPQNPPFDWTDNDGSTGVLPTDLGVADDPSAGSDYAPTTGTDGVYSLKTADIFNILCVPDLCARDDRSAALAACLEYCHERRAMLIVDPPETWTATQAQTDTLQNPQVTGPTENAATYFPWIQTADPAANDEVRSFPPSGSVAGAWVRTDIARGVFKAPAGERDGILTGVSDLSVYLNDPDIGALNPLAVNCLRRLSVIGPVIWGARTMQGADILAEDQWRYISVRRLTLMLEESLYRGLRWAVFEPNDEPLWSTIRVNVGTFMDTLFRQGAFQGRTAREAYLVQCDAANNPQSDIDRGIVNVLVGFAPLKPAEFVFVHIKQISPLFAA